MRISRRTRRILPAAFALLLSLGAAAQTPPAQPPSQAQPPLQAQPPQPNRILPQPDLSRTTRLSGHLPAWVNPTTDLGPAPDDTPIRLTLLLSRTPALQAAFDQLLADQQNPASPRYHQWLTPAQIGEQFGPTTDDVAAISTWLSASGLHLDGLSPSRTFVTVTGTTASAAATFAVAFHQFAYNGQPHLSATTEPTIPAALAPVLTSIEGLTDLPLHPMHRAEPAQPRASPTSLQPLYSNSTNTLHYTFPGDFNVIYDIVPTTNAGYSGIGVKVAVIGRSEIANSDITELETLAGLPNKVPNVVLIPGSADPGVVTGDTGESTLDVGRVLTTATGAQADLVLAASAAGGLSAALQYNVNTLLDPVMTLSYGLCESSAGASNVNFFNTLFSQAAAEGISTFISSGDAAAAGCSSAFTTPTGMETLGMGNYLCASSYVTCVGGTEFNDPNAASYWAPGPTSTVPFVSALGYIPEGAWNEPTTTNANGATVYQIAGTGSGPSAYIAKPSFQTGTGVPADGARDIPDVSFTAAGHDGYFACLASSGSGFDCSKGGGVIYSGTSASAPSMAAIAAILDQRLGKAQGNINPLLYQLAASNPAAFHDATPASSGVTCTVSTASICNNSVPTASSLSGGLAGYPLQVGYDLVTGLGSLDVTNFINASVTAALSVTSVAVSASPAGVSVGQSAAFTATVTSAGSATPTGTIQFFSNGASISSAIPLTNGVATSTAIAFPTAGTYAITATYSGDLASAGSTSAPINFIVTSLPPTLTVAGATSTTLTAGQTTTVLSASVTSASGTGATPTGSVQFNSNGKFLAGPIALTNGKATSAPILFATSGTDAITAVYSGDTSYAPSTSNAVNVVVNPIATGIVVNPPSSSAVAGSAAVFTAGVLPTAPPPTGTPAPTGTVQFFANGTAFGSPVPLIGITQTGTFNTKVAGTYAITAQYSGDATFAASTSAAVTLTVTATTAPTGLTISASPSTLTISSAAANTTTSTVTASTPASFTGSVTLACAVTPTTSAPPTCSLSASTLTFTSAQTATATLTLATITPHDHPAPATLAHHTPFPDSPLKGLSLAALLLALIPVARRRRFHQGLPRLLALLPLTLLLGATLLTLSGCGSSGSTSSPPPPALTGTTAGAYVVTVTATSGSTVATSTVNITVQ